MIEHILEFLKSRHRQSSFHKNAALDETSDLHEETGEQRSLHVQGVASRSKGGYRDRQLDPLQSVCQLSMEGVGHQQSRVAQEEILTPLFFVRV